MRFSGLNPTSKCRPHPSRALSTMLGLLWKPTIPHAIPVQHILAEVLHAKSRTMTWRLAYMVANKRRKKLGKGEASQDRTRYLIDAFSDLADLENKKARYKQ